MLYVLVGNDIQKRNDRLVKIRDGFLQKYSKGVLVTLDSESFSESSLKEYSVSNNLFGQKNLVIMLHVFTDKNLHDIVMKNISIMHASKNVFVIVEEKLLKKDKNIFEKQNVSCEYYTSTAFVLKKKYNIFSLSDVIGIRNTKQIWLVFSDAIRHGVSAEELHVIVMWQIKNMLLVKNSFLNPGLHPFVYKKTLTASKKFSNTELQDFLYILIEMFHNSRFKSIPMKGMLEKFLLEI